MLNDNDLNFVDDTLEKYGNDDGIISASELEGFLTAIVSGPDMIMPSEWMPLIWGGADAMPEWESEAELRRFMNLVMTMQNIAATTLMTAPSEFEALIYEEEINGETVMQVDEWCSGYMRAIARRPMSWARLPDAMQIELGRIAMFGSEQGYESLQKLPAEKIPALQAKVEPAARALHAYWLKQREHLAPAKPVHTPIRAHEKIGRNDLCPCGSGKKYKKCCGVH